MSTAARPGGAPPAAQNTSNANPSNLRSGTPPMTPSSLPQSPSLAASPAHPPVRHKHQAMRLDRSIAEGLPPINVTMQAPLSPSSTTSSGSSSGTSSSGHKSGGSDGNQKPCVCFSFVSMTRYQFYRS